MGSGSSKPQPVVPTFVKNTTNPNELWERIMAHIKWHHPFDTGIVQFALNDADSMKRHQIQSFMETSLVRYLCTVQNVLHVQYVDDTFSSSLVFSPIEKKEYREGIASSTPLIPELVSLCVEYCWISSPHITFDPSFGSEKSPVVIYPEIKSFGSVNCGENLLIWSPDPSDPSLNLNGYQIPHNGVWSFECSLEGWFSSHDSSVSLRINGCTVDKLYGSAANEWVSLSLKVCCPCLAQDTVTVACKNIRLNDITSYKFTSHHEPDHSTIIIGRKLPTKRYSSIHNSKWINRGVAYAHQRNWYVQSTTTHITDIVNEANVIIRQQSPWEFEVFCPSEKFKYPQDKGECCMRFNIDLIPP